MLKDERCKNFQFSYVWRASRHTEQERRTFVFPFLFHHVQGIVEHDGLFAVGLALGVVYGECLAQPVVVGLVGVAAVLFYHGHFHKSTID